MRRHFLLLSLFLLFCAFVSQATVFGNIRGIVHDPQHRPIVGASVQLKSATSGYSLSTTTDSNGEFSFPAVPFGDYTVTANAEGFSQLQEPITLESGTSPVLHFMLSIPTLSEKTVVTADEAASTVQTVTPTTLVDRQSIQQTPGADSTNSLNMITDFTPGAYTTHDMLHMRGGHQTTWLIDGVPIPDTNIATSIGPRVDPKDIDYVEILRGSYNAEYGDRTYGEFNILPRSGFDMNSEGELVATIGSFYQTDDQLSFGSHTQKFAYYASVNGNRSNLGLETPVPNIYHDAENGFGGFTSLLYNVNSQNQFRFDGQLRRDFYQIPYDPDPDDFNNQQWPTSGLRDNELESDGYALLSWVHTFNADTVLTVSPFYHYNSSGYHSSLTDTPVATDAVISTTYGGGQSVLSFHLPRNDAEVGIYSFAANQNEHFGLVFNDGSGNSPIHETDTILGAEEAIFVSDNLRVNSLLTLIGGVRATHFSGGVSENTTYPRIGGTLKIPAINWVFRAFWGKYYQPPPLVSLSGPLLGFIEPGCNPSTQSCCNTENPTCFLPLHGERDEEHQFGVTIPLRGWSLDVTNFETRGTNFLDHNNIGDSSVFIPVTIAESRIRGTEVTIRSPRIWHRGDVHLAYSNQMAQAAGEFTGGLITPDDPPDWEALDHDQRNTLNFGFTASLPWKTVFSSNIYYGSGFANGSAGVPGSPFQADYLPGHTQVDLALAKSFGERFSIAVNALNVTNRHLLIDNSLTFGGFHYNNPREIYAEFRWHFHF